MKTILGTGQLGMAIMEKLLERNPGETITMVNRSGRLNTALPKQVQLLAADVTNPDEMLRIARQSTLLFSCTDVAYTDWKDFYPAVSHALAYAMDNSNAYLVFADNLYSYGNIKGMEMHEGLRHSATTRKGKIRAEVLETLLDTRSNFHSRVAFVKAADFIGPRIHKGLFGKDFLDRLYSGKTIQLFGNIHVPHTFTYIKDFAEAMINIGLASDCFGQTWHVPNAPALSPDKWLHLFEVIGERKAKKTVVPKVVIRIASLFSPFLRELYEMAYQFEYPYLVNHDKYVNRFGNHASYPSDIVKDTIAWYLAENKGSLTTMQ